MTEPVWLTRDVIIAVQEQLLARFGGLAGIRDMALLESALGRPQHLFTDGSATIFQLAASYAFGIVKNHPFVDGNKRAGLMAAYVFLGVNGQELDAPEPEAVLETLGVASGDRSEAEFGAWLARHCRPIE